jgi:hypothetical protein
MVIIGTVIYIGSRMVAWVAGAILGAIAADRLMEFIDRRWA